MFKKYWILFFILFSSNLMAQNSLLFQPDFSGESQFIPKGTNIMPLCSDPSNPNCFRQWTQQAVPLASYFSNFALPQYNYYLPSFISLGLTAQPKNDEEWEEIDIPYSSYSRSSRSKRDFDKKEDETATEDLNDSAVNNDQSNQKLYNNKLDSSRYKLVITDKKGQKIIQEGGIALIDANHITPSGEEKNQASAPNTQEIKQQLTSDRDEQTKKDQIPNTANIQTYQTNRDTQAIPTGTKQIKQGCIVINKEQTEAKFCFICLSEDWIAKLLSFNEDVKKSSEKRIQSKIIGNGLSIDKICSPASLQAIIDNFERTCPLPYRNNFNKFFKEVHCKACQKGAPVELMMAMMSIESAGKCQAEGNSEMENSLGLFQINGRVHKCTVEHTINTEDNAECLKNPINNLNKSVEILTDYYKTTSSKKALRGPCKSWIDMDTKERDNWRRAVSAYNGGPLWVQKAIKQAQDSADEWESLRLYYFKEKLSTGTGRKSNLTVSNLAHTEAVLGRNIKGSPPGLIEFWSQYKSTKGSLDCP